MGPCCGGGTMRETARLSTAASHLSAGKRYASVPGGPDPGSQTAIAERSRGVLHLSTGSVRNLRAEIEMYDRPPALGPKASPHPPPPPPPAPTPPARPPPPTPPISPP